jgi:hypothetical protein
VKNRHGQSQEAEFLMYNRDVESRCYAESKRLATNILRHTTKIEEAIMDDPDGGCSATDGIERK